MTSVVFENSAPINIRAIKTFGVCSKESENPIGYFGTGLKYAIGILLRERQEITIITGGERYEFGLKSVSIRKDNFEIVTMNCEELGFTSEIGKNWELWMAYRELYCNMLDEGGKVYTIYAPTAGTESSWEYGFPNRTFIIVTGAKFLQVHNTRRDFILSTLPDEELDCINIHPGESKSIFYQGINVGEAPYNQRTIRTYNVTRKLNLTEDRTVKDSSGVCGQIATAIVTSQNPEYIKAALLSKAGYVENDLRLDIWSDVKLEPDCVFFSVVSELSKDKGLTFNPSALKLLEKFGNGPSEPERVELTIVQEKQLSRAVEFSQRLGFKPTDYDIKTVETLGKGILGLVRNDTIYISLECFDMGTKMLAGTLIEEFIHLRYKHEDCSRGMQNFLFNKIVSLGEELDGEPL